MKRNRVVVWVDPELKEFVKSSCPTDSFNTILRRMLGLPELAETRGRPKYKKEAVNPRKWQRRGI